jgi:hypothetical protein
MMRYVLEEKERKKWEAREINIWNLHHYFTKELNSIIEYLRES